MATIHLAAEKVVGEELTGTINGTNMTFTTAFPFKQGTQEVYWNGIRVRDNGCDYTSSESVPSGGYDTITFVEAPMSGDALVIDYTKG